MVKAEQVPEEVLRALCASMGCEWAMQDKEDQIILRRHIAAALNAWPEIVEARSVRQLFPNCIVLPLPQESNDE